MCVFNEIGIPNYPQSHNYNNFMPRLSPLPFSHVFYPGGVDFDAGGNGGALLMDDESSKKDAKKERVIEDSFLTDDQLSSRSENFLTWE